MSKVYIAIDGNEIGKIIEKYILRENINKLSKFSKCMNECVKKINSFIKGKDGEIIMSGGDNILAIVPEHRINSINEYIAKCNADYEFEFAIGSGRSLVEAYLALKFAKANHLFSVSYNEGNFSNY